MNENIELVERVADELDDMSLLDITATANRVVALVEQDVARRLLSDGAVDFATWQIRPIGPSDPAMERQDAVNVITAALAAIGIGEEASDGR